MAFRHLLLAPAILALSGCSDVNTTSGNRMTDSDLERAIESRLNSNPDLQKAQIEVDANVSKNEATLEGTVATQSLRAEAVAITKTVRSGLTVKDEIKVDPTRIERSAYTEDLARATRERAKSTGDKIGDSLDDAWIHTKVTTKLMADSETPARKINVDVVDNAVTLRGEVESETAKKEAGRIATETEGVKRVTNRLVVRRASQIQKPGAPAKNRTYVSNNVAGPTLQPVA